MRRDERGCRVVRQYAGQMLERGVSPSVACRLLTDVLRAPGDDPRVAAARAAVARGAHARVLSREQRKDGGWGRFHSADTAARREIPTTEFGVERAVSIGLGPRHLVRVRARRYISDLLQGRVQFPDPAERNGRWAVGARLFAAATLARVAPRARAVDETWQIWSRVAERALESGSYSAAAETEAHAELTGVRGELRYLGLPGKYHLVLLGSRGGDLDTGLSRALVGWVWGRREGIGYLGWPLSRCPSSATPFGVEAWMTSLEIVSLFPGWQEHAGQAARWLWEARRSDGSWDLGPRWRGSAALPLSDSRRDSGARPADWSVRVMSLLAAYHAC